MFTKCLIWFTAIMLALAFAGTPAQAASVRPDVRLLRTPEGGLQPQMITDAKGVLHLIYLKGDPAACDVFYAVSAPGTINFSKPRQVNTQPGGAVALGTIRGAQMALGRNGRIHVMWNGATKTKTQGAASAPLFYTRLNDAGNAFEPERNLIGTTIGLDGGGSVAADQKGNVFLVWHALPGGAPEGEGNRAVFLARSADDGRTFATERIISPKGSGACGCCGLKAFVDSHDRVGVVYRAARGGMERDVTLLMSHDAGATFTNLVVGPWRATTCPMSSMALVQGFGDTWNAAWETAGQIQIGAIAFPAWSCGVAEPEGQGKRKHPVVVVGKEGRETRQLTAWVEDSSWGKGGSLAWELIDFETARKSSGRVAGVPAWSRIAAVADKDGGFTIIY